MTNLVLAPATANISELKKNPMQVLEEGEGQPVAILNRNQTVFYCVPPDIYEQLVEMADDQELNAIADARLTDGQESVKVSLNDL